MRFRYVLQRLFSPLHDTRSAWWHKGWWPRQLHLESLEACRLAVIGPGEPLAQASRAREMMFIE
jgi:hypothetical protein